MDGKCAGRHASVVDLTTRTVTATLDAKTFGANRLKFPPDGKLVLISSLGNGDLVIYDASSRKEFKRVQIGHGAAGILMDRDGNRAFIACGPDNYVAVLNLKTLEVASHIDVAASRTVWPGRPDRNSFSTRSKQVLGIAIRNFGTLSMAYSIVASYTLSTVDKSPSPQERSWANLSFSSSGRVTGYPEVIHVNENRLF
jgi:WD40 repeat protein